MRPGMGKTTCVYATYKILKDKGYATKLLVICPLRPAYNVWPSQCKTWEEFKDLRVGILHGDDKEMALRDDSYDIYVINPEGLEWLFQPTYGTKTDKQGKVHIDKKKVLKVNTSRVSKFSMLTVDESTKFKDYSTNRFALLKYVIPMFKRRYILTGTITPNGLLDLFGQIYILDTGSSLGRFITHYREKYFHQTGYGGYTWAPDVGAKEAISKRIAPLVIQVDHKDHLDMPAIMPPNDIYVDLPPAVMKQYKEMERKLATQVAEGTIVAANAAVASGKCRQIANGAMYTESGSKEYVFLHGEKLDALGDLVEGLQGEPLLIAYVFDFDRRLISERLKIPVIGRGKPAEDMAIMEAFREGRLPAVMGHPETISLGLDGLQDSCSNLCWYGIPWNLLHYVQTFDRIWRPGQRADSVSVHRILARGTIDERVVEVVEDKDADETSFMKLLGSLT